MAAPVDPYDFQNLVSIVDAAQVDLRFKRLFDALDKTKIGLDGNSFKDGAFTAAKFPLQAWQTVTILAGGTVAPASLSYYKDALGLVHFKPEGHTFTANIAFGTLLATLPAGYRPGTTIWTPLVQPSAGGQDTRWVSIDTAGAITMGGGASQPALGANIAPAGSVMVFCDHGFRAEN